MEKFEKNDPTIALNIFYIKEKEILPAYISKHNSTRKKQIILLMIPNEEKEGLHYLAVKKYLHYYLKKHKAEFYRLNLLNSFRTENKLKSHEKARKKKGFFEILMPSEKDEISRFNQYMKSDTMPFIIYADIEP